jgi:hypothetical protein
MTSLVKKAVLGTALAASTLVAVAPAEAQYRRYHRGRGDATGAAILGGIIGLGVGAAIASNNRRDRYYDDGYYYGPPPRVYYRDRYYAPPPRVIYRDRYYRGYPRGYYGGYYGY